MLDQITALILTHNESPNIGRTLDKLLWAKRILVLDSFSTDETLAICRKYPNVEIVQRKFDTFAGQCNFGLTQIQTPWVLSMDADYVLDEGFADEIATLNPDAAMASYRAGFVYCVYGRRLRATLYPPRVVLYRRERAQYRDEGHGHRVMVEGRVMPLQSRILHDDRKSLDRWLAGQNSYAMREVENLLGSGELNAADRIRKQIVVAPIIVFLYALFIKGLILDGWPGWFYVSQRTMAEIILSLRLIEKKLKR